MCPVVCVLDAIPDVGDVIVVWCTLVEGASVPLNVVSHPFQRQMKETMVRSIYCEMLGYEADFTYIHAIKLAQQGSVLEKRVGECPPHAAHG